VMGRAKRKANVIANCGIDIGPSGVVRKELGADPPWILACRKILSKYFHHRI